MDFGGILPRITAGTGRGLHWEGAEHAGTEGNDQNYITD